ncbi:MAG: hypothetical protein P8P36_01470 [Akkermansiaceae bacterium]|nr:hypothetical protein [Akkermansiaceae bacterium]
MSIPGYLQASPPNYEDHIRPVFENACFNCHNPDKQKGDLDLTTYTSAMRGGSGGKFAEPGEGADSKIFGVITHTMKPKMPPKGDKLNREHADLIRAWIDGGLLENKFGKPKKRKKPSFVLGKVHSAVKPTGEPLMPQHLLLEPVVTSDRATAVADMASSPWAPLIAITGQRQVILYNTDSKEMVGILPFDKGQPEVLSFHPSGKYLLAGGGVGGKSGTTVTWDIRTGDILLEAGKDYDAVIAASLRLDLGGVSLGGPGKRVKLWDTQTDEQLLSIKKHTDWVTQLAYSPDGVLLASGGRGGDVYVWEADTGHAFHNLRGHKAGITGMAWRTDSNLLATVSEDGDMIIWEMNNGKQVKKQGAHKGGVISVDWNQSGHLVTSGRDKKVKIWKPDFKLLKEFSAFEEIITEVSFSYDGKQVFAANWSGVISVLDIASSESVGALSANPPSIASRIETLLQEVAPSEAVLVENKEVLQAAGARLSEAAAVLSKLELQYKNTTVMHESMLAERTKNDSLIKEMSLKGEGLGEKRQQVQHELIRKRELSNKHKAAVAVSRREHQEAEKEGKKLIDSEKRLLNSKAEIIKAIKQKPEDEKLEDQLVELRSKIEVERSKLSQQLKVLNSKRLAFLDLSKGQETPGDQLALAETAWADINENLKVYHADRKELNDTQKTLIKRISEQKQLAGRLEKDIKSAREKYTKFEENRSKSEALFDDAASKNTDLLARIKYWQAAVINAEAINLTKQITQLKLTLQQNMDDFILAAADSEQIEDPVGFAAKTRELLSLRNKIDEATPLLLNKQKLVAEKKERYNDMLEK